MRDRADRNIAVVTAVSGIVGAVLGAAAGGYATYKTTQEAQTQETKRQHQELEARAQAEKGRVDAQVRGTARHLLTEFERAAVVVVPLAGSRARSAPAAQLRAFTISASADDLKLLFARLDERDFNSVAGGLRRLQLLRLQVARGQPVTLNQISRIHVVRTLVRARGALEAPADVTRIRVGPN
jgi:uncharacterized protein HemX